MALVTVNGQDAIETRITTPRTGAWHVDALVDIPSDLGPLAGRATINVDDGALVLAGTIIRSGLFTDTGHVRIVAGAGGLGLSGKPRHYNGTSVRIVLGDLLTAGGETLSPTADQSILSIGLNAWTTGAAPIGSLISLLLAAAAPGAAWRSLPDGTVWVGFEMWRDAAVNVDDPGAFQLIADNPETNSSRIAVDAPVHLVGTVLDGRQVSATEAIVGQLGDGVEMTVWYEDGTPGPEDRLRKGFARLAQRAAAQTNRVDYGRHYPATIVSQSGATVDVQPDLVAGRALLPDMAGVPLWLGLPGASVDGTAGGRVMIGWLGGDPARPFAAPFDQSSVAKTMTLAVLLNLYLGQEGAPPAVTGAHQGAEATMVAALISAFSTLAGACGPGPLAPLAVGFTAVGAALTAYQTAAAAANNFLSTKVGIAP